MKMMRVMVLWKTSFAILCGFAFLIFNLFFFLWCSFFLFTMSTELLLHSVMADL